jgi:UDP-GlcNAc:undecaprenyl-phosphate GlcNAc-1-phosphate transferase
MSWAVGLAAVAAFIISILGTFFVRSTATRFAWLDQPSKRKVHEDPIPLMGGIAMYASFVIVLPLANSRVVLTEGLWVLAGATMLLIVGVIDDRRGVSPKQKLAAQVLAGFCLIAGNVGVAFLQNPWLNSALTILWVVGICNAMNLLDNMDGLSAGVTAIASTAFLILAVMQGQIWISLVAAVLLGATLGFLFFNWNPATIFMGDAGSLLLGFLLAVMAIKLRFPVSDSQYSWIIPILIMGVPIFDTTLVSISRLRRGIPLSVGGKDHTSHRLVRCGLSVRQAVGVIYAGAGVCAGVAIAVRLSADAMTAFAIAGLLVGAGCFALVALERVDLSNTGQTTRAERRRMLLEVAAG